MESLGKKLMLGGSMAAMVAAISAGAQAQDAATPETVTVSASRISIQGYEAATPVTVIGLETLNRDAKVNIGDAIRELPSMGNSDSLSNGSHSGNASQGDAGLDTVNLRNLGVVRTLVLFDGQRVVTSNPNAGGPPAIGGVDLNTIPSSIIERVDVVTGGASAAWGSDAVAGVVNLVINKHFSGFKANVVYGNSEHQDQSRYKLEAVAGTDFMGGRGHIEFAGNYTMSPDAMYNWNRRWYDHGNRALYSCAVVNGGAATALCHTPAGTYGNQFTNGGLITASAAGTGTVGVNGVTALAAANALKGIQFVGPNAQAVPFNYGVNNITPGTNAVGSNCYNCSGNPDSNVTNAPLTGVPYHTFNLFNYTSFRITDDISASVMLNYGWNAENNQANNGRQQQLNIKSDNAFIPSVVQQQLAAGGIPSFSLGTAAIENWTNHRDVSFANIYKTIAQNYVQNYRQMMRGVFTLTGGYHLFGSDWSWNAYAQNSSVRERQWARYNTINTNFANAVDAVVVTATGPNSIGGGGALLSSSTAGWDPRLNGGAGGVRLMNGTVVGAGTTIDSIVRSNYAFQKQAVPSVGSVACRSALTAVAYGTTTSASTGFQVVQPGGTNFGCVPLNVFGDGNTTQAALNYIAPGRYDDSVADQALYRINQSVFSVSTQGTLPWGLEAGNVAVALGFENRLEQQRNTRDPLQLGASGVFESGNFSEFAGAYNVQEGFLELNVPILKNNIVESLDFNAAGRITSYSTSGLVQTWKLGMTSQINEDIKVRATFSSDIRAPGIGELFSPILVSTQTQTYPPGGGNFSVKQLQAGNPLLVPEQASTISGGIVLTPHWIENLSMSFDWYSITLHGGIFSPSSGQIFSQCAILKDPNFCQFVFFGSGAGPGQLQTTETDANGRPGTALLGSLVFTADANGAFNAYYQGPVNANRETVSGLDFQVDYNHELLDGTMSWHVLGNYTDQKTRTSLGVTVSGAGQVSGDGALNPLAGFTSPKLHAVVASTYDFGPWSVTAQARIIGSARLTNNLTQSQTVYTSISEDENAVPAVIYGDFRASYRWNDYVQFYGAIDNAFNGPPPNVASINGGGVNCQIYDCIGRAYRIGVRFSD
jgi:outer membrane receptor protein involved in Fe transport